MLYDGISVAFKLKKGRVGKGSSIIYCMTSHACEGGESKLRATDRGKISWSNNLYVRGVGMQ